MISALWGVGLVPLAELLWRFHAHRLGANPIEFVTHRTGDWALNFLVLTLCAAPLARLSGKSLWLKLRRPLGLLSFLYASLHFLTWFVLDHFFDFSEMWGDVLKRRFVTAGMAALLLMIPLAVTSTDGWIRRLGSRWGKLHRLVYPCAILAVTHYYWLVKKDERWPLRYAAAVVLLLGYRAWTLRPRPKI